MKKILWLAVALIACGEQGHDHEKGEKHDDHEGHAHAAKNGGELFELGAHEGFLEAKLDHGAGTLKIWIYMGEEMTPARPAEAPVLNLVTKDGPKTLTAMLDDGVWVFADEALKSEPESARFRFTVGGKSYSPAMAHTHDHEHEGG